MVQSSAVLIVNGKSRRGREWFPQVQAELHRIGLDLIGSELVKDPKRISPLVQKAIKEGVQLVCVGGGDGTFSAVAKHFVNSESVLGVLPLGTGNSLARDLGIPVDISGAAQILAFGEPEAIDLGQVNGQTFVNIATVGLTTLIAENLDDQAKKRFGRAVYVVALFRALAQGRRFRVVLELPEGIQEHKSMQVVVGNGRFHGGPFPITPEAEIDSGLLAGYTVNTSRKGVLVRYALRLWQGRHVEMPEVVPFRAPWLKITTKPIKRITVDGEVKLHTPGDFKVLPQAIKVMVERKEARG